LFSDLRSTVILPATTVLAVTLWLVPAPATAQADPATTYAETAFAATNAQRARHDRARLRKATCLTRMAQRWARHMARTGRLVHQDLNPIAARCDLSYVGENIAMGYPGGASVVNRGWMHSAGHRANILRPQYRLMGLGAARDQDGRWWSSQVFGRH
jgi:uncharacterized protein YkwD